MNLKVCVVLDQAFDLVDRQAVSKPVFLVLVVLV
jgi:hypothetical protein